MSSAMSNRPTGRAKSCVVCRQFKLACDARKTAPEPCSRCVSKKLKCRFDPNFRRVSTRKIAQDVADELHTLRAAQNAGLLTWNSGTPLSNLIPSGQSPPPQNPSRPSVSPNSSPAFQHSIREGKSRWLNLADDEDVSDQTYQGIFVSSNKILELFYHFERYLYPHAPFMQPVTTINDLAVKRPFLFWTILLLAVERYDHEGGDGLYEQLCIVHEALMPDVTHTAIQNLETVHAILLLCLWPIPKMRNAYDPAWNYVGLATNAALSLNCHQPTGRDGLFAHYKGMIDTPAFEMDPGIQGMTWLGCFQIGARLSTSLGLPPPICSPQHSRSLRRALQLATDILTPEDRAQIKLLDILTSAQVQLDAITDNDSHYSMTEVYELQIDSLRTEFQEHWSWNLEAQCQSSKMYLLGMTLTLDLPRDSDLLSQAFLQRQLVLERSMRAASSYISTMTDLSNQEILGQQYASGILTFYPKHYYTSLMGAVCYLFRFLVGYQGTTQSQQILAITRITEAHRILQSFPEHRDAVRACISIEMMVDYIKGGATENVNDLVIKTRLGASVTIDAMFRAAHQRNRNPADGSIPPVAEWSTLTSDSAHVGRLPPPPGNRLTSPKSQVSSNILEPTPTHPMSMNMPALGIWDAYSYDFGMMNEPWMCNDAEFAMF